MTPLDLLDGVQAHLKTKWPEPETTYYTDYAPQNFKRPSILTELENVVQDEMGYPLVGFTMEAKITAFLPVDAYHRSHIPDLSKRMGEIMSMFGRGYFPVGSRRPHVVGVKGNYGYDYAQVILSIQFTEQWAEGETYPLCESVNIRVEQKEE